MPISRLQTVPLRELWKHEAHGFSRWLVENLDLVSDLINIPMSYVKREAPAGLFSADIMAEDDQGHTVVIENQLEQTNHEHLGKLITYMSNLDAKTAIWITKSPRPEHEKAVNWLNEFMPKDIAFYLLKIEAFKIGNSDPAPKITVIAGPTQVGKKIGEQKKELAERHILRFEFWKGLLELAKTKTNLFDRISPSYYHSWIHTSSGIPGFLYLFSIKMENASVLMYLKTGEAGLNKRYFDELYQERDKIETSFGDKLNWLRMDDLKGAKISYIADTRGLKDKEAWHEIQEKMVDAIVRLERAFQPFIQNLKK